jgi:hypothetical protein
VAEPDTERSCLFCATPLASGARVCRQCDRFQDWRRFFPFTSTVLSMLVALTSVLVVGLPPLLDSMREKRAKLIPTFQTSRGPRLSLLVHNAGNVAGIIDANAVITIPTTYEKTGNDLLDAMLPAMSFGRVTLALDLPDGADALVEPGRSRQFEFVGEPPKPWSYRHEVELAWVVDSEGVLSLDDRIFGGDEDGFGAESDVDTEPSPDASDTGADVGIETPVSDAAGDGTDEPGEPEVLGSKIVLMAMRVEPVEEAPRSWSKDLESTPCELSVDSLDAYREATEHRLAIPCDRVAGLYSLLPARVRVHAGEHVTEHEIVAVDPTADLHFDHRIEIKVDRESIRDSVEATADELFREEDDLF